MHLKRAESPNCFDLNERRDYSCHYVLPVDMSY